MNAEMAKTLMALSLQDHAQEWKTTAKVIAAIPIDQVDYRPHEKSMTAIELAWHLAGSDLFFLDGILKGQFAMGDGSRPENVKTPADVLAAHEAAVNGLYAGLGAMTGEQLATPIDFFGMMSMPAVAYMQFCDKHNCHHRGQLSTYLRPMGAKVPAIYGPSGDESIAPPPAESTEAAGA